MCQAGARVFRRVVVTMAAELKLRRGSHDSVTDTPGTTAQGPRRMVRLARWTILSTQGSYGQIARKTQTSGSHSAVAQGPRARV